eukprot:gene19547-21478_t
MVWNQESDVALCREILVQEPYRFKTGSRERGQVWDSIAKALISSGHCRYVDQRAVRDRFVRLEKTFKKKMALELRASGIDAEQSELDQAMEEIVERSHEAQEGFARGDAKKQQQAEKDKEMAENVRKRAMERFGETTGREVEAAEGKKKRRSMKSDTSDETVEYLKEKGKKYLDLEREKVEMQRRELELKERMWSEEYKLRKEECELRRRELTLREQLQQAVIVQNQAILN